MAAALLLGSACASAEQTELARGNAWAGKGNWPEAAAAYQRATQIAPTRARAYELLGNVHFEQRLWAEARQAYAQALRVDEANAFDARVGLARLAAQDGLLDEAFAELSRLIETHPTSVYALLSRATVSLRRRAPGDPHTALRDSSEAVRLSPRNPAALYTLGCARMATAQGPDDRSAHQEAIATFDRIDQQLPRSPLGPYGRARAYAALAQRSDVIVNLREARDRALKNPGSWSPAEVRADPSFRALESDVEFLKLLEGP